MEKFLDQGVYEPEALIHHINKGHIAFNENGECQAEPFTYCEACNQWLNRGDIEKHLTQGDDEGTGCKNRATRQDIIQNLLLYTRGSHDLIRLQFVCPEDIKSEGDVAISEYYITLKEMILQSILIAFNMSERELGSILMPFPNTPGFLIIIYESEEGGIGVLKSLTSSPPRWERFLKMMAELMHIKSVEPFEEENPCKKACYNCLLGYWNQHDHPYLNRNRVINFIRILADTKIEQLSADPVQARLQRLKNLLGSGLDSELERRVLDKMFEMNIILPEESQYPITKQEEDGHSRTVSVADYFYVEKHLCVFVDGPPHATPSQKLDDQTKRREIRRLGYGIYVMDFFTDIEEDNGISDELIEQRLQEFRNSISE